MIFLLIIPAHLIQGRLKGRPDRAQWVKTIASKFYLALSPDPMVGENKLLQ